MRTDGSGPPVLLLHGFTQTGACMGPLADDLARDHRVLLVDLPGHGGSAGLTGADLWTAADAVARAVADVAPQDGPVTVIGYSLGGRLALHLALRHPDTVQSLVLIGATAGIDDDAARAPRAADDAALADHIVDVGVDAFLHEWLAQPLFADLPAWARFDAERRANTAAGLADSLRHAGTGVMEPLWDRLGAIDVPSLVLAGERDAKFAGLARRLAEAIGADASVDLVPDAGHAAHLEAPDDVISRVRALLD
jgi:2-succinyl-6-hydroxy-2,4-cyclohexadiene-1-carboxylate synthase